MCMYARMHACNVLGDVLGSVLDRQCVARDASLELVTVGMMTSTNE